MIEAILSIALAASVLTGVAGVLRAEWDRTRCAVVAFETAHRRLAGGEGSGPAFLAALGRRPVVRVTESGSTVTAEAHCGSAVERVELVKLEAARW